MPNACIIACPSAWIISSRRQPTVFVFDHACGRAPSKALIRRSVATSRLPRLLDRPLQLRHRRVDHYVRLGHWQTNACLYRPGRSMVHFLLPHVIANYPVVAALLPVVGMIARLRRFGVSKLVQANGSPAKPYRRSESTSGTPHSTGTSSPKILLAGWLIAVLATQPIPVAVPAVLRTRPRPALHPQSFGRYPAVAMRTILRGSCSGRVAFVAMAGQKPVHDRHIFGS